jgi:hypothetical protein
MFPEHEDAQLAELEAKGQLVLRVKLGLSHLPWSKCIEWTREIENLKINTAPSATWPSLIFSLLVKIPEARFKTQGAVEIHQATSDKIGLHSFIMYS